MSLYHSNGKLLLSGEYAVLDGATALVLPVKFGQSLKTEPVSEKKIFWKALDENEKIWFEATIEFENGKFLAEPQNEISERLSQILKEANELNPEILSQKAGFSVLTSLEFPKEWGLGTSSTLINNVAQWFKIDPFELLDRTFGGSGFDIAAAKSDFPITFVRTASQRSALTTSFYPSFHEELFFVYLNRKQNSRDSIKQYRENKNSKVADSVEKISSLTHKMITCTKTEEFEMLMEIHENIISQLTGLPKVKSELFPDFSGSIKSLGGWGGDFILATGGAQERDYFRKKGYSVIFEYKDLIL